MAKPIRWTKRLWKIARGQDAMQNFYSRRETPLLLAYWRILAQQECINSHYGDPLRRPICRRLAEYKDQKSGEFCDPPF